MTRFSALFVVWLLLALSGFAAPRGASAQDAKDYQLGAEDVIQIQIWQHPDLSGSYTVDSKGFIRMPLLGQILVKNRTAVDVSKELQQRYSIVDPTISEVLVSVTGFNSLRVAVVGEVKSPGRYGFQKMPSIWDALLAAGGAATTADMSRVQLVHKDEASGSQETITVDLSRGLEGTAAGSLPALKPGDTIVVPGSTVNVIVGDQVEVLGAVKTPGMYPARSAVSVMTALAIAGGANPGANLNKVNLARRDGGAVSVYSLNVEKYLTEGTPNADLPLQAGDVLSVSGGESSRSTGIIFQGLALLTTVTTLFVALNNKN